jgi:hypothetical protein
MPAVFGPANENATTTAAVATRKPLLRIDIRVSSLPQPR